MLYFFQASTHEALFYALEKRFRSQHPLASQSIIVPSMGVANDLRRRLCDAQGLIWQLDLRFWAMWEWSLIERSQRQSHNYEFAPLGSAAMRWKLFAHLQRQQQALLQNEHHPLYSWLRLLQAASPQQDRIHSQHLWHFASEMARILGLYLHSRSDWLTRWLREKPPLAQLVDAEKLAALPEWLQQHYERLYAAQYFIFKELFAADFAQREAAREAFYRHLPRLQAEQQLLPDQLWLYLLDEANPRQMDALRALGEVCEVQVFHLCNSHHYLADLKDERWLQKRLLLQPETAALHYDSGHVLLSRFGKMQRAQAQLLWEKNIDVIHLEDEYTETPTLLRALQSDMQQLHNEALRRGDFAADDASLRLWGCHGLPQQLEHVRSAIAHWLSADRSRSLSDVLLLFPHFDDNLATIRAIFPAQGAPDGYRLPARISGVFAQEAQHLWDSVTGFYQLLEERFDLQSLAQWLLLPESHQAYGLSAAEAQRALNLLREAGFRRGFDEAHLRQSLHPEDADFRFSFCAALDVLLEKMLGAAADLPFAERHLLNVLCQLAEEWQELRTQLRQALPVREHVAALQRRLHGHYAFAMEQEAHHSLQRTLRDLDYVLQQRQSLDEEEQKALPLRFVLDWVRQDLAQRQSGGEPSGVITISTLRAMRRVPYRFIAFLQAEQERFPRQQLDERYNLQDLDRPRLGDRSLEEDDGAAFLDMLTAAKERLWFYYDAVHPDDHERRLPAQPLQELWQHLQQQRPEWAERSARELNAHPFEQAEGSPLQSRLQGHLRARSWPQPKRFQPAPWFNFQPQTAKLDGLIQHLQSPAHCFLKAQQRPLPRTETAWPHLESLHLDALESYRLRQAYLNGEDWEALLPAGAAGLAWRQQLQQFYASKKALFLQQHGAENLSVLRPQSFALGGGQLQAHLPTEALWLSMDASRGSPRHYLRLWLEQLAWCAQNGGGWRHHAFEYDVLSLAPLPQAEAQTALLQWWQLEQSMQRALFLLPVEAWTDKSFRPQSWWQSLQRDKSLVHRAEDWLYVLGDGDWQEAMAAQVADCWPRFYPLFQQYRRSDGHG